MNGDNKVQPTAEPTPAPPAPPAQPASNQPIAPSQGSWQYRTENDQDDALASMPVVDEQAELITGPTEANWTASEYIAHNKGAGWFIALGVVTIGLDALIFLWTRDLFTAVLLPIMAVLLGIIAARKPQVKQYRLDAAGLSIGQKFYSYGEFKSFSVVDEGPFSTIVFLPMKRFMPPISIYYEPKDEQLIMQVLSNYLPFVHTEPDMTDRMARRLRF